MRLCYNVHEIIPRKATEEGARVKKKDSAKRLTLLAMLLGLALILGWVESILPPLTAVPGVKLGLGNITVLFALYVLDARSAFALSCAKVLLSSLLFGGVSGLMYSAAGAFVSFIVMVICKRFCRRLSAVGVSAAGGAAHTAAQVAVAMLVTAQPQLWRLLAPLLCAGTISGVLTGTVETLVQRRLETAMKSTD